ncbi:MAG: PAAR domain-containing protein [Aquincola sp.]|nr:PAAR domain-containing protein [Aquincola sp.]
MVKPKPQRYPVTHNGKLACYEGDPVYCNTCKSWGVTKCVPPYRPHVDPQGRQANLDGDLCLCKCPTPPRLKASFENVRMAFEGHEIANMAGAIPWLAHAGHLTEEYEIIYEIVDAKTEKPVDGLLYKITSGGKSLLDGQKLEEGRSKPYSVNEHPALSFIAWMKGEAK